MTRARAAVDSGTNSTRLLVVDAAGRELVRTTRITRLGQGVDATGRLDDAACERTLAVMADHRRAWESHGVAVGDVRIAATSAVRDAANRDAYLRAVRETTGVAPEVLTGDEEARLSFAGAVGAVEVAHPTLVVDIGGGSTELVVGDHDGVRAAHSMQVGSVRLTERHLAGDPPGADEVAAARATVEDALDAAAAHLTSQGGSLAAVGAVVGVAGTVATLAALATGRDDADDPALHGTRLAAADVEGWAARLLAATVAERRRHAPVTGGRADVIAAGALVLDVVRSRTGVDEVVASRADVLDGLVASLAG